MNYADEVNWNNDTSNNDTTSNATNNSTSSGTTSETTENESTSNGTATTTGNVKHTFTKKGNQGVNTYAHDMKELRETFLNVTNQIINDERISELFMRVY